MFCSPCSILLVKQFVNPRMQRQAIIEHHAREQHKPYASSTSTAEHDTTRRCLMRVAQVAETQQLSRYLPEHALSPLTQKSYTSVPVGRTQDTVSDFGYDTACCVYTHLSPVCTLISGLQMC